MRGEVGIRAVDARITGEGAYPRVSACGTSPPPRPPPRRKSGLPDLRIIDAELGQARVRMRGEGAEAANHICISTVSTTWITPFDCSTSAIVIIDRAPLRSPTDSLPRPPC